MENPPTGKTLQPSLKRLSLMHSTSSPTDSSFSGNDATTRGPRPLQLLNGPRSPGPSSAPLHSRSNSLFHTSPTDHPPSFRRLNASRRQSSISYSPKPRERDSSLRSSLQLGPSSPLSIDAHQDRRSSLPLGSPRSERAPVTLAEKHADLLHFIAQKESKCLELRSQLAVHEAELLSLKRKWERIVSRGNEGAMAPESATSPSFVGQGVVLDGLKGGVQGVGRFIAGLGDLAATSSSPLKPERLHKGHVDRESTSSTSTYSTATTRFSQSSESSLEAFDDDREVVRTAADESTKTPAIKSVRSSSLRQALVATADGTSSSSVTSRRAKQNGRDEIGSKENLSRPTATALDVAHVPSQTPSAVTGAEQVSTKEFSLSLPPPASIPGLSALSNSATVPPLSSWVGSVGKKIGEFQKTQKRASVLLTDVSNSFFAAIASPSIPSSLTISPNLEKSPQTVSTPNQSAITSRSHISLLDDDDEDGNGMAGDVTQRLLNVAALTPDRSPTQVSMPQLTNAVKSTCPALMEEDEEDWNW